MAASSLVTDAGRYLMVPMLLLGFAYITRSQTSGRTEAPTR